MTKIVAVSASSTGNAKALMAAEALQRAATELGQSIKVETALPSGPQNQLTQQDIQSADAIIVANDTNIDTDRFNGKPLYKVTPVEAIRHGQDVIQSALAQIKSTPDTVTIPSTASPTTAASAPAATPTASPQTQDVHLVAITSCPTGIAHTFMAAEALERAASALGYKIKVETQGSVGAQNTLTPEEIKRANAVVIAADAKVDKSRFAGKPLYETSTNAAMNNGQQVLKTALNEAVKQPTTGAGSAAASTENQQGQDYLGQIQQAKTERSAAAGGPYKHLMTGVSFMLPFVVAGGLLIAISFAVGGIDASKNVGSLGWGLNLIGASNGAFSLIVPILSGYIAYSIADRPGIAPGMIGGVISSYIGAGFLGGIISGFLAGYLTFYLNRWITLPRNLAGLKPILILPLLSTGIVGLLMVFVLGGPVSWLLTVLTHWLESIQGANAFILGLVLGGMMAIDMGGPINKSAYTFSVGLLSSHVTAPMAAVMAAGMTPPLGLALATFLFKNRFTRDEHEAGKAAFVLGLSFVTEGAIPFAARDPLRVLPATMIGSAVAGALSMILGCKLQVPHGGIFVLLIPGAINNLLPYLFAIVAGTIVTTGILFILKRPTEVKQVEAEAPTIEMASAA